MPVFVIPALNESDSIYDIVKALRPYGPVVVVDDGSWDGTAARAEAGGASIVVRHERPKGIAASLIDGWLNCLSFGEYTIVQLDAGFSHDPLQNGRLLDVLYEGADMAVGSRFVAGGQYVGGSALRQLASRLYGMACNACQSGPTIRDWTSGYRAFRRPVIEHLLELEYVGTGHAWQAEVLARVREAGFKVGEAPITYQAGTSSLRPQHANEALRVLLHILNHIGWTRAMEPGNPNGK